MRPNHDESFWVVLWATGFAAFGAFAVVLQQPPGKKLTWQENLGRVFTGMVAGYAVCAGAEHFWGWQSTLLYALGGLAGVFGDRVFIMLAALARARGFQIHFGPEKPGPDASGGKDADGSAR